MNPAYECKGVRLQVHFVKTFVPSGYAKVQLTLYDGQNILRIDDGRLCNWASKQFDSQNLLFTMPQNLTYQGLGVKATEIQRGEILAVDDEITWLKDLYRLQFDGQGIK